MVTTAKRSSSSKRHAAPVKPGSSTFSFLNSVQFSKKKYARRWLIDSTFAVGEIAIIGGPKKCLKTHLTLDAAISIGSGQPFLDRFQVSTPRRVAVFSGETSHGDLQDAAKRIAKSKGISLAKDCNVLWATSFPRLGRKEDRIKLKKSLKQERVDVVIIDPLYLTLLDGACTNDAGNLYAMGPVLRRVAQSCMAAGATPILVHHMTKTAGKTKQAKDADKKQANAVQPPDLDDLAWSGVAEFARQWLLVKPRTPHAPGSGVHELLVSVGGSAGHSGCWQLDVDEGTMDSDFSGRYWDVEVRSQSRAKPKPAKRSSGDPDEIKFFDD